MKITYQKENGEVFDRMRNTYFQYRVGDTTPIGWKVLDIQYKYKDKYYSKTDYDDLVDKRYTLEKRLFKAKQQVKYLHKNVNHILVFIILLRSFEIMITGAI